MAIPGNIPLKLKIGLTEGKQIREQDKVFGINPTDFIIQMELGKIDTQGIKKNFKLFEDSSDEQQNDQKNASNSLHDDHDHSFHERDLLANCLKNCIIRHNSKLYKAE